MVCNLCDFFINRTIGKAKNLKAKIRTLNKTTESLPNSQGTGQTCETKKKNPTETPKTATPFSTAGMQDELDFGDVASFLGGEIAGESTGGDLSLGIEIFAGVSHAEGQLRQRHLTDTSKDDLKVVTTPPLGNGSEQCEVPNKTASDFILEDFQLHQLRTDAQWIREHEVFRQLAEKLLIDQSTEILNQEELQNEATRAEDDRVATATRAEEDRAKSEADRVTTFAMEEADRVTTFTRMKADRVKTFAREDADRHLARRKLQLRQRLARLKLQQQYLAGNVTDRSAIPEHGGDQPMQRDRHTYVEYELGAEIQIEWTPARGEKKFKSKNAQDQSSTAGQLGVGGIIFPQDLGWSSPIKIDAQLTPEVALKNGDFR